MFRKNNLIKITIVFLLSTTLFSSTSTLNQKEVLDVVEIWTMDNRDTSGPIVTYDVAPFQAVLISTFAIGDVFCGGALIGEFWVVTAAHCVHDAYNVIVYLGMDELYKYKVKVVADRFVIYPLYSPTAYVHDLALVHLSRYKKPPEVKPIALNGRFLGGNVEVFQYGWSKVFDKSKKATNSNMFLHEFKIITTSHADCYSYFGNVVTASVLCAYALKPVQNTCSGDSGSPMIFKNSTHTLHAATANFISSKGCNSTSPMVFSRTSYYKDWMRLQTGV